MQICYCRIAVSISAQGIVSCRSCLWITSLAIMAAVHLVTTALDSIFTPEVSHCLPVPKAGAPLHGLVSLVAIALLFYYYLYRL